MALCIACGSGRHEQEDCGYRDEAAKLRAAGIAVTPSDLRRAEENGLGITSSDD